MGAGESGGGLILLHRNGRREVPLEGGWERTPGGKLKTNIFLKFFRKCIDKGVIGPYWGESVHYGLKSYSKFRN